MTLLLLVPFVSINCSGGRSPSPKSAQSITKRFFKNYGKKYKESVFAHKAVSDVGVNGVREQSRHVAEIDAFVDLKSGERHRVLVTVKKTPPIGWNVISWEIIQ